MFNIFNNKDVSVYDRTAEIENRDLLWVSYDKDIPSNFRGVGFTLSVDDFGRIKVESIKNENPDPSTIWVHLPVKSGDYSPLPYWPHYIDLTPQQRFAYLSWLRNIDQPIDTGFVFLYFYGLERHLVLGDIDKSVNQIIRLRNVHQNKSFFNYSENSIIHACVMRNRLDLLLTMHEKTEISGFKNVQFLIAYNLGLDLSPENLLEVFFKLYPKARKAIREDRDKMVQFTSDSLTVAFGKPSLPIKHLDITKIKTVKEARFCNYSFPDDVRHVEVTDFYSSKELLSSIDRVFNLAYESYKKHNSHLRKLEASGLSEEELFEKARKKDLSRYKKLLSEKKITQDEFEVLNKYKLSITL